MTGLVVVAACMIAIGIVFLWLLLHRNAGLRPRGGLEWTGTIMSGLLIVCAGFLMALALAGEEQEDTARRGVGRPASDIAFKLLSNDAPQRLSDYSGQVVLLNFWATWCQPCITELPELDKLHDDYAERGLAVVTLSDEPRDVLDMFEDLWPKQTVSGYVALDAVPEPYYSELVLGRPISYVIDREGVVREFIVGAGNYDMFERFIRPYI